MSTTPHPVVRHHGDRPWSALVVLLTVLAALLLAALPSGARGATVLPAGFTETTVFPGLTAPTVVRFAADGRVFVAEKGGTIKVFDGLGDTTPTVFADLGPEVQDYWDRGLLGMALDPQFPARPYVYVLYTYDGPIGGSAPTWGDNCPTPPGPTGDGCVVSGRISRLTASGDVMSGTEKVLVHDWCQQYPSHSVGSLGFGPDGALYASGGEGASFTFIDYGQKGTPKNPCGDPPAGVGGTMTVPSAEGGALRSQDLRTPGDPTGLAGSVIRIDPDTGAALPDNPLAASSDANARRIIAEGLRNPFRFTFRPGTSELWVGDVGFRSWEEINRIASPTSGVRNFGWPCYEGAGRHDAFDVLDLTMCEDLYASAGAVTAPYYAYAHMTPIVSGEACPNDSSSVTGLAFVPASAGWPAAYTGSLLFADYSRNCLWLMPKDAGGDPSPTSVSVFGTGETQPIDIEFGPGGLYVVDLSGAIRRISYGTTNAPTAVATAGPRSGPLPLTVSFDASASTDPDPGDVLSYAWDLDGDGLFDDATGPTAQRTYSAAGTFATRVRVTDSSGLFSISAPISIEAANTSPTPVISSPAVNAPGWAVGDPISFSGSATDAEQGTLPASALTWDVILHHCSPVDPSACHVHPLQTITGVASGSFAAPDHEYPSYIELRLTASDGLGGVSTVSRDVQPRTVDLTLKTNPAGGTLSLGSYVEQSPFTHPVIVGSTNTITAPANAVLGGSFLGFTNWSDGGSRSHEIVAPAAPATYTATYASPPTALAPDPAQGGWQLNGAASVTGGGLQLTPVAAKVAGSAFWPTALPSAGLDVSFDADIDSGTGADGLTLALADPATAPATSLGLNGGGLGWSGISGIAVALDTYKGTGDPSANFVGIATGPNPAAAGSLAWSATSTAVPALRGATRHVQVTYSGGTLVVKVDGVQYLSKAIALPSSVRLGFTGSTGGKTDRHAVSNVLVAGPSAPPPPAPTLRITNSMTAPAGSSPAVIYSGTCPSAFTTAALGDGASATPSLTGAAVGSACVVKQADPGAGWTVKASVNGGAAQTLSKGADGLYTFPSFTLASGQNTVAFTNTTSSIVPDPADGGWQLNGSSSITGGGLQLTPATADQAGSAFWPTPLASDGLSVSFDSAIDSGTGADGLTLALADPATAASTALGLKGGGLGWSGISGIAVALDTYKGAADPSANFVGIATGPNPTVAGGLAWAATSTTVPPLRGTTRRVQVTYAGGTLTVKVDGVQYLSQAVALPPSVRLGFTGGSGGKTDRHAVANVVVTGGAAPPPTGPTLRITNAITGATGPAVAYSGTCPSAFTTAALGDGASATPTLTGAAVGSACVVKQADPGAGWTVKASVNGGAAQTLSKGADGLYTVPSFTLASGQNTVAFTNAAPSGATIPPGNLTTNPSFETDLAGWGGYQSTRQRVAAADAVHGGFVALVSRAATATGGSFSIDDAPDTVATTTAGQSYRATAWVRAASASSAGKVVTINVREKSSAGTVVRVTSSSVTLGTSWTAVTASAVTQQSGGKLEVYVSQQTAAAGDAFQADLITLVTP